MNLLVTIVLLVAVVVVVWRRLVGRGDDTGAEPSELDRLRRELLIMNRKDAALVDRLVAFERERTPDATEEDCYRAAIRRMRR